MQQLLIEQLQDLQIASQFSDVPMCAWVNQDGCVFPVVAYQDWIMPKDCFVMMWFWLMADAKFYNKLWNHESWNPVLWDLNTHNQSQVPNKYKGMILDWIYIKLYARVQNWSTEFKHDQIVRIMQEIQEDCPS